jgi:nicotinamide-nucleotide amidase
LRNATAKDKRQAQKLAEKDEELLRNTLGELVYGTEEQTLADVVGEKLVQQNKNIAVAESCTGGRSTAGKISPLSGSLPAGKPRIGVWH